MGGGLYVWFIIKCFIHTINDHSCLLFSVHGARHRLARVVPCIALQTMGELQFLTATFSRFSHY